MIRYRAWAPALVIGLLAVAVVAAPSSGQSAKPTPCIGYTVQDPEGDQSYGLARNYSGIPSDPMTDITGIFFRTEGSKVFMNIELADASKTAPSGTQGIVYRLIYSVPESLFLDVEIGTDGSASYSYGHFSEDDGLPTGDGETSGEIFEGAKGVIKVLLPPSHGGKVGMKVLGQMFSSISTGLILASTDSAPDEADFSYPGTSCAGGDPGGPTGTPTASPTPGPGPGPGGTNDPKTQPLGKVTVTAKPSSLKAKKVKKAKKVSFSLTASEKLTDATVDFKKGSKVLGSAKAASLEGTKKVSIKLKKKGLKKGNYTLVVNGKRSNGTAGNAVVKIKVK